MYMYVILNWYTSTHIVILRLLVSQFQTSIDMVLAQGQKVKGIDLLDQQYVTTDEEHAKVGGQRAFVHFHSTALGG